MNQLFKFLFVSMSLVAAGCDAVWSPEPLGDTVLTLEAEEWQGTWLASDMVITTTVLDRDKGLLQVAWIERGEKGADLELIEGSIRASGELVFANILDSNENVETRYSWLLLDKSDNALKVWAPNLEQFKAMVTKGDLPGAVTEDGVVLGKLTSEHLELIGRPSSNLLDWKDPGVFTRVGD